MGHDHAHQHHATVSSKHRLIAIIAFNMIITMAEFIGGIISGSLALVSDAWHNLTDVLSLMLAYAGEKVSEINPGRRYSFGLKRFEVLVALFNASTLVFIGMYIVYEAVMRFINLVPIHVGIMLSVGCIGLLGNMLSIFTLSSGRNKNLNTRAAFAHLLYDAISSLAVIAGGLIVHFTGLLWIDLAVSLLIVGMILFNSLLIIRESITIFLQGAPQGVDPEEIYADISAIEHVTGVHGLHIWSINSNEIFLSCHICIDKTESARYNDDVIEKTNVMLREKYRISHTALQIENSRMCALQDGACCN